jgi:DMSO/TMAO reductase YedYZ molybdopterin-dependent catalytic subunit
MTFIKLTGIFAVFMAVAASQVPATLAVQGIGGTSATLSVSDLSKLPQQTVKVTDHGTPATFEGVLLTDVLAKVDLPLGEKFHTSGASYLMVVEGKDGYRAVFAWAELDASFMDKSVYVVTKRDGKPLTEKDGPFQLVVPGEKRAARWVRQVTALRIRQAN